jgi:hypothetical protein
MGLHQVMRMHVFHSIGDVYFYGRYHFSQSIDPFADDIFVLYCVVSSCGVVWQCVNVNRLRGTTPDNSHLVRARNGAAYRRHRGVARRKHTQPTSIKIHRDILRCFSGYQQHDGVGHHS